MRRRLGSIFVKPYHVVGPAEAQTAVAAGAILLDVREPQEWAAGHAPDARHIPLGDLPARMRELPSQRPVVVVCRSGHRSARAARLLADHGLDASNLKGGMSAWATAGLPVVARGGRPGRIT